MSTIQNFVEVLDGLKSMKTGISGSRIKKITQIAVENVSVSIFKQLSVEKYGFKMMDSSFCI